MSDSNENPPKRVRGTEETDFPIPAQLPPLDKEISRKERLITLIAAAIVAALVSVVLIFGFRAFQGNAAYGPEILEHNQLLKQQGKAAVAGEKPIDVYYPIPYASPPNLTVQGDQIEIVEQKADHFQLKKKDSSPGAIEVQWLAQGLRSAGK
jgi:hypothetical protein